MGEKAVDSVRTAEYDILLRVLKDARRSAHITQRDLSLKLGKSFSYIGKVEKGTRRIDVIEFIEVANAIGIDAVDLFRRLAEQIQITKSS